MTRAIPYYEELDLLQPERTEGGQRIFSCIRKRQEERVANIKQNFLRGAGREAGEKDGGIFREFVEKRCDKR